MISHEKCQQNLEKCPPWEQNKEGVWEAHNRPFQSYVTWGSWQNLEKCPTGWQTMGRDMAGGIWISGL